MGPCSLGKGNITQLWAAGHGRAPEDSVGMEMGAGKDSHLYASRSAGLMKESGEVADNRGSQDPRPSSDLLLFLINSGMPLC